MKLQLLGVTNFGDVNQNLILIIIVHQISVTLLDHIVVSREKWHATEDAILV
jgi:hypothetical protein